ANAEESSVAFKAEESAAAAKGEGDLLELEVKFELSNFAGPQYLRHYVAIWLEDAKRLPVRTALLWMTTKEPGPRWHRDLYRWYRNDQKRKMTDGRDLIGVISGATRGPGEY